MPLPLRVTIAVVVIGLLGVGLVSWGGMTIACIVLPTVWSLMLFWYFVDRPNAVRRERLAKGLGGNCGYDLRGNVSGVCPECGKPA